MRQALSVVVVATLLTAAVVDIVAAGVKTLSASNRFHYAASTNGIAVAVPVGMKSFPTELLPQ
ncbi:MAG: hypothetical protein WAU99_04760 [Pseudolabrys sp.]